MSKQEHAKQGQNRFLAPFKEPRSTSRPSSQSFSVLTDLSQLYNNEDLPDSFISQTSSIVDISASQCLKKSKKFNEKKQRKLKNVEENLNSEESEATIPPYSSTVSEWNTASTCQSLTKQRVTTNKNKTSLKRQKRKTDISENLGAFGNNSSSFVVTKDPTNKSSSKDKALLNQLIEVGIKFNSNKGKKRKVLGEIRKLSDIPLNKENDESYVSKILSKKITGAQTTLEKKATTLMRKKSSNSGQNKSYVKHQKYLNSTKKFRAFVTKRHVLRLIKRLKREMECTLDRLKVIETKRKGKLGPVSCRHVEE